MTENGNTTDTGQDLNALPFEKAEFKDGRMRKRIGRPTKFNLKLARKIFFLTEKGLTDAEIAQVVDVSQVTMDKWKKSESYFMSLKKSKEYVDNQVKSSLLKRATGYEYDEEFATKDGPVICKRMMHPDVTACLAWLNNRRPHEWRARRDKEDTNVQVNIGLTITNLVRDVLKTAEQEDAGFDERRKDPVY